MIPATSIVGVRQAWVSYLAAVCLILLTASPYTAPFSTCDEAELTGDSAGLDKRPGGQFTDDSVDACAIAVLILPFSVLVSLVQAPTLTPAIDRSALLTVLRI
jgi:hypothetical protein